MDDKALIQQAISARKLAYAPYSGFFVGAALLTREGTLYLGGNIENAAYTPTICAERVAFFKAVSQGERNFSAIAVVGGAHDAELLDYTYPCGVCRQVMMEFCNPDTFRILTARNQDEYTQHTLAQLLPFGFGPHNLT